ncbi:helix-turn-helix transcriptional regulator [Spiribacter halobius]|uniref:AraC family transcriptional regulator n=1 Tax=Sediminicurvatus halobius TaxID=2182432 RepID=A0A2U2N9T6_9GAMM|nr:AraC family transcriptional regulator [Spiribacter halobius]PWG65709.1 AraC family transcriptional regulator [Spiribacter halobius]UEX77744.1 AraC family transcriptional regulator [Spiribacter halobius]
MASVGAARDADSRGGQILTPAELSAFETRYRLRHRFARAANDAGSTCLPAVAEGRVEELEPRDGLRMVGSDLIIHRTYAAVAQPEAPAHASVIVLLQGTAELECAGELLPLRGGGAALVVHPGGGALSALHPAGQHIRAVNVSLLEGSPLPEPTLAARFGARFRCPTPGLWPVPLPRGLAAGLDEWLRGGRRAALAELEAMGLALQLLAHALPMAAPMEQSGARPVRERALLERVRQRLETRPGESHTLDGLAALACMSPSALREKFAQAYGCSVFTYLRERRLTLARRLLEEGQTVQAAAETAGYTHPSNFATAFRARFGIPPRAVRRMRHIA